MFYIHASFQQSGSLFRYLETSYCKGAQNRPLEGLRRGCYAAMVVAVAKACNGNCCRAVAAAVEAQQHSAALAEEGGICQGLQLPDTTYFTWRLANLEVPFLGGSYYQGECILWCM